MYQGPGMNIIEDLIADLPSRINNTKQLPGNTTIQLCILGSNGGNWYIQFKDGTPTMIPGYSSNPDLSLTCTFENFMNLSCGELDPGKAFMTGKLTIQGDITTAQQLLGLLKSSRN
jgi:putative sterol carrier protein